ncbi:MAG: AMP-binding protein [Propionibacteriales bacterium]|nr:AMP-binding protein [Propionibacteriales bacterium]
MTFTPFDLRADPEDLRRNQCRRLAATVRRCAQAHPYYKRRLDPGLADRLDGGRLDALHDLAVTTKDDFVADADAFRLRLDPDAAEEYVLWDVACTAGTSGGPLASIYQTSYDFRGILFAQQRMAEIRGMRGDDRIMNLYPLTPQPHGAWMRCNHAAAVIGAAVVNGMSGSASMGFPIDRRFEDVVSLAATSSPTVLWGVPSYVRKVLQAVAGDGLRLPDLRMIAVSGEPCTPQLRRDLTALGEQCSGKPVEVSDSLGASELQAGLVECAHGSGHHNPAPELFMLESLDAQGAPVGDGDEGLLAITHVDRRGTVLLRYLLGDRVVLTHEPCPRCGLGGGRILEHRGRAGTRTKIRGSLVDLQSVSAAVEGVRGVREYQIRILGPDSQRDLDELQVLLEDDESEDALATRLADAVTTAVGIRPQVEFVASGSLSGPALKVRRIVDERWQAAADRKE